MEEALAGIKVASLVPNSFRDEIAALDQEADQLPQSEGVRQAFVTHFDGLKTALKKDHKSIYDYISPNTVEIYERINAQTPKFAKFFNTLRESNWNLDHDK
jgi:hypothetical protein